MADHEALTDGYRPSVTVVMAAYNAEAFISGAIDSILAQTCSDLELVVVDDASTDGTWGILQQYARSDDRVRLRRNASNVRQVTSLNFGILQARAPYVAIMDADDIADPLRLEHQACYLDEHPEVGVVGSLYDAFESDPSARRPSLARADGSWRDGNVVMLHATMMVRRDLYAIHGLYDPSYDDAGDYEIQSRFAHGGVRFHVLNEALLHYRVHPGSMTSRRRRQQEGAALRASACVPCCAIAGPSQRAASLLRRDTQRSTHTSGQGWAASCLPRS